MQNSDERECSSGTCKGACKLKKTESLLQTRNRIFFYLKNSTKKKSFKPRFLLSSYQFLLLWNHSLATEYEGKKLLQKHYCHNLEITLKQFITSQSQELCAPHLNYAMQPMPTASNKNQTRSVFLLKNRLQG